MLNITKIIRREVVEIARRHGLSLILLFGSVAAGNARQDSDIDIAIKFRDGDVGLRRTLEIQQELSALFGGKEVDLAILNGADPLFMKKIAERFISLHGEPGEIGAFLLLSFRRYQDHRKYLDMERDFAEGYVKRISG